MSKARIILPIEGMSCASCAATVQEALASADGVVGATVNFATAKAAVDYDDAQTHVAELIKTVRSAGYNCGKRSEEHTSELQSRLHLVCRLLLEKKKKNSEKQENETDDESYVRLVSH